MANEEQLAILRQGVEVWNKWRTDNPYTEIDLTQANLRETNLAKVDLFGAKMTGADLHGADLQEANLNATNLIGSDLSSSNLNNSYLSATDLNQANLFTADLRSADLKGANLSGANLIFSLLQGANLGEADLSSANLIETALDKADFSLAYLDSTVFGANDLSQVIGLEKVNHLASSLLDIATIHLSIGKIPEIFLRGCGLSDVDIEYSKLYKPDLSNEEINKIVYKIYDLRATQAIQIAPLFISYSHADKPFVDELDSALTEKGIRFWRDIHDATAGRLEAQIDRAIRQNPTVLLILSKNSIKSDWVEHEVRTARQLEKELGRDALCPIALDDGWKSSPWPKRVMEQVMEYNILDFSDWEDKSAFEGKFAKLLNGLDLFYKKKDLP